MVSTIATRPFDQGSLAFARDLARRAAVAIDNAQLYQAAVVANESKANFLATMSHELRTPLTAIIGYDELLAEGIAGEVNDAQRQQLDRIKVNARQLLALIEEILLYARVESGRESVRLEEVRAKELVDDAIIAVAPMAQTKHLSLTAEAIEPTLTLTTDSRKLRQMLINLIENAVKFTEHGSVTVRAFARGTEVVFEVQDTGIGIAPENLEHIFEAFWQVEQTKRAKGRRKRTWAEHDTATREATRRRGHGGESVTRRQHVSHRAAEGAPKPRWCEPGRDGDRAMSPIAAAPILCCKRAPPHSARS